METSFQFGIEEEYFLADAQTRGTPHEKTGEFHAAVRQRFPQAERELLQSQIEVATPPSTSFKHAQATLSTLRKGLAEIASIHGLRVLAAGTHPIARWSRQSHTEADRYEGIMRELRMVGRRSVICGMHVHVEVPEPEARVDLMNRLLPFTPLLLALSASSPFWQGQPSGLAAYRLSAFGEMPRSGLPDLFANKEDYERYVAVMVQAGAIRDASFLWWTLRPSIHYPTLELRVADSCTRVGDAIAIAALYRCLVRLMVRRQDLNRGLTGASRALASENLWRAQRYGVRADLIDEASATALPFSAHLDATLALVAEDAEALGCQVELEAARAIAAEGTSADRQLAVYAEVRKVGRTDNEALFAVVDWLAETTAGGSSNGIPAEDDGH